MPLTSKKTAALDPSSTVKAAKQAKKASSTAAANAAAAAQNAAVAAQNAAGLAQTAAQNAAVIATSAAQNAAGLAQAAAQNAAVIATSAAQNARPAAQTAVTSVSKGVRQGVYSARSWAAPRIDRAADYCTSTMAPKVSAALHTTASQVRPAETSSKRSILKWSMLGVAVLAALGAAAAAVRYRYQTAIAADSEKADEEEVLADSAGSQPAPDTRPATPTSKDEGTETPVNGRVTTTGR
jgi:hypothetical protein